MTANLSFQSRTFGTNSDGTRTFFNSQDKEHERIVAAELEKAYGFKMTAMPGLDSTDYFAEQDNRTVYWIEIKWYDHESTTYPTAWLTWPKYQALVFRGCTSRYGALYCVRYTDGIFVIDIGAIEPNKLFVARVPDRPGRSACRFPAIHVPIDAFVPLIEIATWKRKV